jgi:hypothetical protein
MRFLVAIILAIAVVTPTVAATYQVVELRILDGHQGGGEGTPVEAFEISGGTPLEITSAVFWTDVAGNVVPFGTPALIALGTTASLAWEQGIAASYVMNDDANFVHPTLFPVLIGTIDYLPFALNEDMDHDHDDHHGHDLTAGVPEPATWAMMLLGFIGLAFAFQLNRQRPVKE